MLRWTEYDDQPWVMMMMICPCHDDWWILQWLMCHPDDSHDCFNCCGCRWILCSLFEELWISVGNILICCTVISFVHVKNYVFVLRVGHSRVPFFIRIPGPGTRWSYPTGPGYRVRLVQCHIICLKKFNEKKVKKHRQTNRYLTTCKIK